MIIDISTLTAAEGIIIQGDVSDDQIGFAVSNAGDVNGDGIDDVIIGAAEAGGFLPTGEAYIVYGGTNLANIDLSTLTSAQGILIEGDFIGDSTGFSVSNAGDVNADGIDDVIIGAPFGDNGGLDAGEAYIVFGGNNLTNIDLDTLTPMQGVIIQGDRNNDNAGVSVSAAGDVNGDGVDDVIIGAPAGDNGGPNAGEAVIIFGGNNLSDIDLTNLTSTQGITIQGAMDFGEAGFSVSNAGDVNGDGIDDVIISSIQADNGGTSAGEAYIIFGGNNLTDIDLSTLTTAQGITIQGDAAGDGLGVFTSSAGDVNGDGIDDVIIGANLGDDGGTDAGEAYIIFGGNNLSNIDLSTLTPTQGIIIQGDAANDQLGLGVSAAGDFNSDGIDDIIVGAPGGDNGGANAGEAYIIFGGSNLSNIDLSTFTAAQGIIIQGDAAVDLAGFSVSAAGDVNGDGGNDVIIGAPLGNDGGANAGEAIIIFGSIPTNLTVTGTSGSDTLNGANADDTISGFGDDDILNGLAGNDILAGGTGTDTIDGGAGIDTNSFFDIGTGVIANIAAGTANHGAVNETFTNIENLTGTLFNDRLTGDAGNNVLMGLAGNDILDGAGGNDNVQGFTGDDIVNGGNDDDIVDGGLGDDFVSGGSGDDTLRGSGGNDTVDGGTGDDSISAGIGDDIANGGGGNDTVLGQGGADMLSGGAGMDMLFGGSGNDTLFGGTDDDMLFGQGNNDILHGQSGNDTLLGAAGSDQLFGGTGDDVLNGSVGADRLDGGSGNDTLNGGNMDGARDTFVFAVGYDEDRVNAFDQAGTDRLELDDALWASAGTLTAQQVVDMFGSLNANGTILTLDFGNGDILEVQNSAGIDAATLGADILII